MTTRSVRVDEAAVRRAVQQSRTIRQALAPLADRATRTAQQVTRERVSRQTGRYERSFKSRIEPGQGGDVVRVVTENTAPHAGFIERGTRPHLMPKKASVYVFQSDNGDTVFTHGPIKHPGTTPQRVIEVALKRLASGRMY